MATFTQIDRAKAWLDKTGLKATNQPLYQIISVLIDTLRQAQQGITVVAGPSGSGTGITVLTTDVVATGPGVATAVIQPSAVTYTKIQNISAGQQLLGRETGAGIVQEIGLSSAFAITGGDLVFTGVGASWIPMVDGSEPPVFITDGAGVLILVAGP